jgi:hypothetical protein
LLDGPEDLGLGGRPVGVAAATIGRGPQEVIMEAQALGRRVYEVRLCPFHTFTDQDFGISNGRLPGCSEGAKLNRPRTQSPLQVLTF